MAYGRDFCFLKAYHRLDDKLMSLQISSRFLLKLISQDTEEVILIFGFLGINIKPMQSDKIWSNGGPYEYNLILWPWKWTFK